ncbi:hypothetical protein C8R44DRAFT_647781 [Mycena epipterygia]|nr:hypothetical protein C8R44DRAFT_647781 [Mycena epipterygia]
MDVHDSIDPLLLWFEPTGAPNEYFVRVRYDSHRPSTVEQPLLLSFPSTAKLPAPSPHYFALHAACCRIVFFSGAADHLDKVEGDFDKFKKRPVFSGFAWSVGCCIPRVEVWPRGEFESGVNTSPLRFPVPRAQVCGNSGDLRNGWLPWIAFPPSRAKMMWNQSTTPAGTHSRPVDHRPAPAPCLEVNVPGPTPPMSRR